MCFKATLSYAYRCGVFARNAAYDLSLRKIYKSKLSVICVGNVTVGGTGKTPLVLWIAEQLISMGHRPVICSRGYRGKISGPHLIDPTSDSVDTVGDEPLMMARRQICPVVIARKRVLGAKFIEDRQLGNVIVLDDGLQHRALFRNLNLLCVAAGNSSQVKNLLSDKLLPEGLLREPLKSALKRTDAIIVQSRNPNWPVSFYKNDSLFRDYPVFATRSPIDKIRTLAGENATITECVLLSAIANPETLIDSLPGVKILEHRILADHSNRLEGEIDDIRNKFPGIPIVVTEKDAVKIAQSTNGVFVIRQHLEVEHGQNLIDLIRERI